MAQQNRLLACPEPLTGGEATLTVLFCVPDTPDWRRTATALVALLAYGRTWDEATGSVKDTQIIGRGIFNSMAMCDLETQLTRIADGVEGIEANIPKLYTLAELQAAFVDNPLIDWEQIAAFADIIGILPGIKFDPITFIFQFLWKAQMLANSVTQSTAQTAIAAALAKGLGVEGIQTIIEGLGEGKDLIAEIINGSISAVGAIATLAALFKDSSQGDDIKMLQDVIVNLGDMAFNIESSCDCGGVGCSNCKEGGTVEIPTAQSVTPCEPPDGFSDWESYEAYKCNAANYVVDALLISVRHLSEYHAWFRNEIGTDAIDTLNSTQRYNRISQFLPELLPNSIEYNLTPSNMAAVKQEMLDRYNEFYFIAEAGNWVTEAQLAEDYFGTHSIAHAQLLIDIDTLKQDLYDAQSANDIFIILETAIDDAYQFVIDLGDSHQMEPQGRDTVKLFLQNGLLNIPFFKSSFAMNYLGSYACLGSLCCPAFYLVQAIYNGGNSFSSDDPVPGEHALVVAFNMTEEEEYCGGMVTITVTNLQGHSPPGGGGQNNDFIVFNQSGQTLYQASVPPVGVVGAHVIFTGSLTAFSCDIEAQM